MSKTNYSKMSTKKIEETPDVVVGTDISNGDDDDVSVDEEPIIEKKPVIGKVANCKKLNVRTEPNANADVIVVINEGTEVEVDDTFVNTDFYKVSIDANFVSGYCMKKFIEV